LLFEHLQDQIESNKIKRDKLQEIRKIKFITSGGPILTDEEVLEKKAIKKDQQRVTNLELTKQMQMEENAKMQRQLIELEHDKCVNNQVDQEMNAIQELVDKKDRENKAKFKTAWEAQ